MTTHKSVSISISNMKVRWEEPYTSEAQGRLSTALPRGIYRGCYLVPNLPYTTSFKLVPISGTIQPDFNDSFFVVNDQSNGFSIAVRQPGEVVFDMSAEFPLSGSKNWLLIAEISYSTGALTVGNYKVVDAADVTTIDGLIVLGDIVMAGGEINIQYSNLTSRIYNDGGPIPTKRRLSSDVDPDVDQLWGLLSSMEAFRIPTLNQKDALDNSDSPMAANPYLTETGLSEKIIGEPTVEVIQFGDTGSQDGGASLTVMTDSGAAFPAVNFYVGQKIKNITDGSEGSITSNTLNSVTCSGGLSGGSLNQWNNSDVYEIHSNVSMLNGDYYIGKTNGSGRNDERKYFNLRNYNDEWSYEDAVNPAFVNTDSISDTDLRLVEISQVYKTDLSGLSPASDADVNGFYNNPVVKMRIYEKSSSSDHQNFKKYALIAYKKKNLSSISILPASALPDGMRKVWSDHATSLWVQALEGKPDSLEANFGDEEFFNLLAIANQRQTILDAGTSPLGADANQIAQKLFRDSGAGKSNSHMWSPGNSFAVPSPDPSLSVLLDMTVVFPDNDINKRKVVICDWEYENLYCFDPIADEFTDTYSFPSGYKPSALCSDGLSVYVHVINTNASPADTHHIVALYINDDDGTLFDRPGWSLPGVTLSGTGLPPSYAYHVDPTLLSDRMIIIPGPIDSIKYIAVACGWVEITSASSPAIQIVRTTTASLLGGGAGDVYPQDNNDCYLQCGAMTYLKGHIIFGYWSDYWSYMGIASVDVSNPPSSMTSGCGEAGWPWDSGYDSPGELVSDGDIVYGIEYSDGLFSPEMAADFQGIWFKSAYVGSPSTKFRIKDGVSDGTNMWFSAKIDGFSGYDCLCVFCMSPGMDVLLPDGANNFLSLDQYTFKGAWMVHSGQGVTTMDNEAGRLLYDGRDVWIIPIRVSGWADMSGYIRRVPRVENKG